jgi:hypothetical protein
MKVWSTKIQIKGTSQDAAAKREAEFRIQQMLKELEIK